MITQYNLRLVFSKFKIQKSKNFSPTNSFLIAYHSLLYVHQLTNSLIKIVFSI